jgi:predicted branched-subunit amino acid permease
MASIAPGIVAWGLMTGVAMANAGMSQPECLLMGLLVFAGSAQLAAIPLFVADAPMWVIVATAFCVNLRFIVFSAHLRAYMLALPRTERMITGFFTADLSYVQFVRRYPTAAAEGDRATLEEQQAYLAGNGWLNWAAWVGSNLLGVLFAASVPESLGLGFAGILGLLGVCLSLLGGPQAVSNRLRVLAALTAGTCAVLAAGLPLKLNIVFAIMVAVAVCLGLERATGGRTPCPGA